MKVSVVVPAYNQGRYLGEALLSVIGSSHQPLEVIVVNDGSTDDTARICDQFRRSIRVISQENTGVSAARNAGIRAASGDAIMLLDADDVLEPTWIEDATEALNTQRRRRSEIHVVHGDYTLFDDAGSYSKRVSVGRVSLARLLRDSTLLPSGLLMSRECVEAVGEFDGRLNVCEDWDYSVRTALRGFAFHHERVLAFRHRDHPEGASKREERVLSARLRFLEKWRDSAELSADQKEVVRQEIVRTLLRSRRAAYYAGRETGRWTEDACRALPAGSLDPWLVSYGSLYVAPFFRRGVSRQQVRVAAMSLRDELRLALRSRAMLTRESAHRIDAGVELTLAADAAIARDWREVPGAIARVIRCDPSIVADALLRSSSYGAELLRAWVSA